MPVSSQGDKECEWVVGRCKACLDSNDRHGAKAWILTARSLFPDNFAVQYEAFNLHISCEELKEAAKALADLFSKFPGEAQLQKYLRQLVGALLSPNETEADTKGSKLHSLYTSLFSLLSPSVEKAILLQAADEATSVLRQCKIWLVAIRLFPDTAKTLGLDAYDLLSQQTSTTVMTENKCRELLVCELIPLLLSSAEVRIDLCLTRSGGQVVALKTSHICQWLESVASYYTTITSQALLCGRAHACAGKVGWEQLHQLLMRTAEKCNWREIILSNQIGPHLPSRIRWLGLEKLSGYSSRVKPFEAPRPVAIPCFYIAVFLFFEVAWDYCSEMLAPSMGSGGMAHTGSTRAPWLIVEEHAITNTEEKAAKRRKVDDSKAVLNFSTGSHILDQKLVERFMVATECWDFLQSNVTYQQEFMRLCQQWGAFEWSWLSLFRADMAVYKCDHSLAMQILQHEWHKVKDNEKSTPQSLRFMMQMVNCSKMLGDIKGACTVASDIISLVPESDKISFAAPPPTTAPISPTPAKSAAVRQLYLLSCTSSAIMPFCMEVIIRTLKDVAFSEPKNDRPLGQLLVLLQYQWPKEQDIFASLVTTIQKRRKFTFPEFFHYIILIDFLEEMLYLANCESLQISILPQADIAKSRTITRGVNRGAREELMSAVERQIKRCEEPIEPLLRLFFKQEKILYER